MRMAVFTYSGNSVQRRRPWLSLAAVARGWMGTALEHARGACDSALILQQVRMSVPNTRTQNTTMSAMLSFIIIPPSFHQDLGENFCEILLFPLLLSSTESKVKPKKQLLPRKPRSNRRFQECSFSVPFSAFLHIKAVLHDTASYYHQYNWGNH